MLQNDPVRNLQYDTDIRIAQQTRVEPTVFNGQTNITSVRRSSYGFSQLPIPVATIEPRVGSRPTTNRTLLPISGYDILLDMPSIHIEQTFELNETLTSVASENRYTIRSPFGDALYYASESSEAKDRMIWGSSRPFQMHLMDKTHQEALSLRKKLAMGFMCFQPCNLEVWAPPGDLLGKIVELPHLFSPSFQIENGSGKVIFKIEAPDNFACCCKPKETFFKVYSADDHILKGTMTRKWSTSTCQYTFNIYFNDNQIDVKSRALFLGAGFLMEYLYFQTRF